VIKGFSRKNIISAKNRLDLIVASGRSRIQFTHFLSIAFTSPEIQQNFLQFKNDILSDSEIYGLDESLFQVPQKLHLTIVTLALLDNEDRCLCAELLQDCKEMIIQPILRDEPLKAKLVGLDYMNDDPSSVDVLYGKVVSENLQEISNGIAEYFASRGYSQVKHDYVKLHVTLINSLFRDNDDAFVKEKEEIRADNKDNFKTRVTFDASKILKKYKDFYFGEIDVKEIHLSQRYSKATNGYYESTAILKL
jgi:activating signal cointegrator complex subunit 1